MKQIGSGEGPPEPILWERQLQEWPHVRKEMAG